MVKPEKVTAVQSLKDKLDKAKIVVVTDYCGLTVDDLFTLRTELRAKKVEYRVVKNLLARRALMERDEDTLDELLVGPTAIAFGYEDPVETVKTLVDFQKKKEKLKLKGGLMSGKRLTLVQLQALSKMPSQRELYARMAGSLKSPINKLVMSLKSATSKLVWGLQAVAKTKES